MVLCNTIVYQPNLKIKLIIIYSDHGVIVIFRNISTSNESIDGYEIIIGILRQLTNLSGKLIFIRKNYLKMFNFNLNCIMNAKIFPSDTNTFH